MQRLVRWNADNLAGDYHSTVESEIWPTASDGETVSSLDLEPDTLASSLPQLRDG
jgi:hypothetical protein